MKGPYENNKLYAIAVRRGSLKNGFTCAVFAQVRFNYSSRSSDDLAEGRFFAVDEADCGGTPDRWDPDVADGSLLTLSEDGGPYDLKSHEVLSLWDDRKEAWQQYEDRQAAGRKGAQGRKDRERQERSIELSRKTDAIRARRLATPTGQLEEAVPEVQSVLKMRARRGNPELYALDLTLTVEQFRKVMALVAADNDLVEAVIAFEGK